MALSFQKYRLTITFIDTAGEKVKRSVQLIAANDAEARGVSIGIVTAMQNLSDAKVSGYEITIIFVENALTLPAAADNKEVVVFSAPLAGNSAKRGWFSVPAPAGFMFYATTGNNANIANMNHVTVLQLVKMFALVADGGFSAARLSDGETIKLIDLAGERQHRKG